MDLQKTHEAGCKPLAGILLTQNHDQALRLQRIVHHFPEHSQLKFGIVQHQTKQLIPGKATNSGWADTFCQICVTAVVGKTYEIAGDPKAQDLSMAVFGETA
jgi:hypothetical protein